MSNAGRESEEPPLSEESSSEDNEDQLEKQVEDEIAQAELFQNQMAVADADLVQEQEQENEGAGENVAKMPSTTSSIEAIKVSQKFISAIQSATLDNGKLDVSTIERLQNPVEGDPSSGHYYAMHLCPNNNIVED